MKQCITKIVLLIIVSKLILRNTIVFLAKIMISVSVHDLNQFQRATVKNYWVFRLIIRCLVKIM